MRTTRTKPCAICQDPASVLFRVQHDELQQWSFVCKICLPTIKQNNPLYVYGGTWKAVKK